MQVRYAESQQPGYERFSVTTWLSYLDAFYSPDPGTVRGNLTILKIYFSGGTI